MVEKIIVVDVDGCVLPKMPEQWASAIERSLGLRLDRTKYNFGVIDADDLVSMYDVLHAEAETFYCGGSPDFNWALIAELQRCQEVYDTRINFVTYAPSAGGFAKEARMKLKMLQDVLPTGLHYSYSASHDSSKLHFPGAVMIEDNQQKLEVWCKHWDSYGILMAQTWNTVSTNRLVTRVTDADQLRDALDEALFEVK